MEEKWISLNEYPNYSVSDFGRVRRESSKGSPSQKILKQYIDRRGYSYVCPSINGKPKTVRVHRLVASAFIGIDKGLTVNHIDLNKSNNRLDNLEVITSAENTIHAVKNGHFSTSGSKISFATAEAIRFAKSIGQKSTELAKKYHVSKRTIDRIIRKELWKLEPKIQKNAA